MKSLAASSRASERCEVIGQDVLCSPAQVYTALRQFATRENSSMMNSFTNNFLSQKYWKSENLMNIYSYLVVE
jgi:hypothetical protein